MGRQEGTTSPMAASETPFCQVLGTNTTALNDLFILWNLIHKSLALEDSIVVNVVGFHGDSRVKGHSFKAFFGHDGIRSIESHLVFHVGVA